MGLLQDKLAKYDEPQKYMAEGIYPYFREIEGKQGTEVLMGGHRVLMFGSNAYTGLTGDDRVIEAGVAAMRKYGSGCAGSRFLNGTLDIHVQLEKELAAFVGKEEALWLYSQLRCHSLFDRTGRLYHLRRPRPRFHCRWQTFVFLSKPEVQAQ